MSAGGDVRRPPGACGVRDLVCGLDPSEPWAALRRFCSRRSHCSFAVPSRGSDRCVTAGRVWHRTAFRRGDPAGRARGRAEVAGRSRDPRVLAVPFEPNRDGRHRTPERERDVTNRREYDEGLRRRGSPTSRVSDEAVRAWAAESRTSRGGQACHSVPAILTAPTFEAMFRPASRRTEGLSDPAIGLLGLNPRVPDHGTLGRGAEALEDERRRAFIDRSRATTPGPTAPVPAAMPNPRKKPSHVATGRPVFHPAAPKARKNPESPAEFVGIRGDDRRALVAAATSSAGRHRLASASAANRREQWWLLSRCHHRAGAPETSVGTGVCA